MYDIDFNFTDDKVFSNTTKKEFEKDTRFYVLPKDENGNGQARIRFLPDLEGTFVMELFRINTSIIKNGKKRFVNEISPQNIGLPCPFQDEWRKRWQKNDKQGAKFFNRSLRFVANIKVLKDPKNPENEGKIFMYEMSKMLSDKVVNLMKVTKTDKEMGKVEKQMFNPLDGYDFILRSSKGGNGLISYDTSSAVEEKSGIYKDKEEYIQDMKEHGFILSDLIKKENILSYDQLLEKFAYVTFQEPIDESPKVAKPEKQEAEIQDAGITGSVDDILAMI